MARRDGRVGVDALAQRFGVTPQTIRRDLSDLCARGALARVHGGARPADATVNAAYAERRLRSAAEKRRIARAAAARIAPGSSLTINIGTTTEAVARALAAHRDLRVVTNNLNIAALMAGAPGLRLFAAGGEVRLSDGAVVGAAAAAFMADHRVDLAVVGCSGIGEDGALLDYDPNEIAVARAILAHARRAMLVVDGDKFDRRPPMRIADLGAIDQLVTDRAPPDWARAAAEDASVELVIADAASERTTGDAA